MGRRVSPAAPPTEGGADESTVSAQQTKFARLQTNIIKNADKLCHHQADQWLSRMELRRRILVTLERCVLDP